MSDDFRYVSVSATNVGLLRKVNEDSFLVRDDANLWGVADGMGGHDAGDVASKMIVDTLGALPVAPPAAFLGSVTDALGAVDRRLVEAARQRGSDSVIGSTVVLLLTASRHYACVWAGDSRLYLWRNGVLQQISRDHSLVQDLVDQNLIRPEEAETHPHANVITRAIGIGNAEFEVRRGSLELGDILLLCSDGLTKMVDDREIAHIMSSIGFEHMAAALIECALQHGGKDNVTVVLVACRNGAAEAEIAPVDDDFGLPDL
jgi:serine/threonine protein phosphatase PrpC